MSETKIPPQKIEAEQSVLGSLLIDKDAIVKVAESLRPEHFYRNSHAEIFKAVLALYERREPSDLVTVSDELKDRKKLKDIGGDAYLADLVNSVPTSAHIESYAQIVKDCFVRRELILTATGMSEAAYEGFQPVSTLLDETEQKIFSISHKHLTRHFVPIKDALAESFDRLEELHKGKGKLRGLPTGFRDIDNRLAGLRDNSLVVVAGRPSMGKTALALNFAEYITVHEKVPVGFFSLESSKEELVDRLLSSVSNVDAWKITTGSLSDSDFEAIGEAMGILAEAPLFIDDTPGASIMEMRTKARRLQLEQGLRLLIVDYLQLAVSRNLENRVQEVSEISQGLKNLARELRCPVLAVSQLSRAVESRGSGKPQLSDLRESGCLTGDTPVQLSNGERVPIRKLAEDGGPAEVLALNEESWQVESILAKKAWPTGGKAIFRLRSQLGYEVKASANHKFRTLAGWKRLDQLQAGEHIALPRSLGITPELKGTMNESEVALLAHLIGDGCTLPRHAIQYTTKEKSLAETVARLATSVFADSITPRINRERNWWQVYLASTKSLSRSTRNPIAKWLDNLEVWGKKSPEKRVPEKVFQQPEDLICQFLRHLWATDGTLGVFGRKKPRPIIFFATSSKGLANDVRDLLLRVGTIARVRQVPQHNKGLDQWHVIITVKADVLAFIEKIGVVGPKEAKLSAIRRYYQRRIHNTNKDVIPKDAWQLLVEPARQALGLSQRAMQKAIGTRYCGTALYKNGISRERALRVADAVASSTLRNLAQSDVYWDKVKSVEPLGVEKVYDLEVPGHHNFIAGGVVVHNSIEQDSDVVMFLYRPEEEEQEQFDHIRLAIAKHRNGPTGNVDLIFKGERTRFYGMEKKRAAK